MENIAYMIGTNKIDGTCKFICLVQTACQKGLENHLQKCYIIQSYVQEHMTKGNNYQLYFGRK